MKTEFRSSAEKKKKNLRTINAGNLLALLVGMQIDTTAMESSVEISLKLGIKLPYDPTVPLLDIYPKETIIKKNTYPSVHCNTIYSS